MWTFDTGLWCVTGIGFERSTAVCQKKPDVWLTAQFKLVQGTTENISLGPEGPQQDELTQTTVMANTDVALEVTLR